MGKFTICYLKPKYKANTNQKKKLGNLKDNGYKLRFPSLPPVFLLNSFLYQ